VLAMLGPGCLHLGKAGQRAVGICYMRRACRGSSPRICVSRRVSRSTLQGSRTLPARCARRYCAPHAARGIARPTVPVELRS
jgi:hypothetical protein